MANRFDFRYSTITFDVGSGPVAQQSSEDYQALGLYVTDSSSADDNADGVFARNDLLDVRYADGTYWYSSLRMAGHTADGIVFDAGGGYYMVAGNSPYGAGALVPFDGATPFAVCFYAGTMIATPDGMRAVEDLAEGDLVTAADGAARAVKWMWRQTVTTIFADPLRSLPVIVRAGALGDNLPVRDLIVSPDHALLHDGMLVHAGALVNGSSVVCMTGTPEHFTYYHIELEDHALVMAEGVAAETFVDNVTRRRFDNWAEYEARFGDAPAIDPFDLPRVKSARQMPQAMRQRLTARAVELAGHARAA